MGGDNDAFEQIVALYENELYFFINERVRDNHEAKHLMIESFARLAVGGRRFAEKSSLKTYLFTIGKNLALGFIKERGRERHIAFEEAVETMIDEGETLDVFIEQEENKRALREAMEGLKDDHRVVLTLLYFKDMSYIQAGRTMKKTEKQIKDLAYRAKAALKKELENRGFKDS